MWSNVVNIVLKYLESHPDVLENLVTVILGQIEGQLAKAAATQKAA